MAPRCHSPRTHSWLSNFPDLRAHANNVPRRLVFATDPLRAAPYPATGDETRGEPQPTPFARKIESPNPRNFAAPP